MPKAKFRWDKPERFVVFVEEAKNIPPKDGSGSSTTYLIAKPNGLKSSEAQKTDIHRKSLNPAYRTLFTFVTPLPNFIDFEIYHKAALADKLCARVRYPVTENQADLATYNERTKAVVLQMAGDDKKTGPVRVELRLRLAYSTQAELRELVDKDPLDIFYYRPWASMVKAGDLILYSGSGPVETMTKLLTDSPYTGVGMVLELPNKWTKKKEFYIIELTSNKDMMLDAYREDKRSGCSIFRLWERVHQYHGTAIWWLPLRSSVSSRAQERLSSFVSHAHARVSVGFTNQIYSRWEKRFLTSFGLFMQENGLVDTYQAEFCGRLLRLVGKYTEDKPRPEYIKPSDLAAAPCFSRPVLFRVNSEFAEFYPPSRMPADKKRSNPQLSVRPSEAKYQADRRRLTEAKSSEVSPKTRPRVSREPSQPHSQPAHLGRERKEYRPEQDVKSLQRTSTDRAERIQRRKTMGPMDQPRHSRTSHAPRPLEPREPREPRDKALPRSPTVEDIQVSDEEDEVPAGHRTFEFALDNLKSDYEDTDDDSLAVPMQFLDAEKSLRFYNKSNPVPVRSLEDVDFSDLSDVMSALDEMK